MSILNGILTTGNIPEKMKISVVRPIYKNGAKNDPVNYRPIAIWSVLSHVLEKYISTVMINFLL